MSDLTKKEKKAIELFKFFEPKDGKDPYYVCYSGGKDSDCIRILAKLAGVRHEVKHNLTTVDAPETVRYVRETIGRENIERPEMSMWQLIVKKKFPPTRAIRYCCEKLKEYGGQGRKRITGVRWAESLNRKNNSDVIRIIGKQKTMQAIADEMRLKYRISPRGGILMSGDNDDSREFIEYCYKITTMTLNPIIDWTESDVWEFLHYYGCEGNPLYQCGFTRIGCVGCPMAGGRQQKWEFARYPKYRAAYVRAFDRMIKAREEAGLKAGSGDIRWRNGEDVMRWWVGDDPLQITVEDYLKMLEEMERDE